MKFHWQSQQTGEIVENFGKVLKAILHNLRYYKFFDIRWKYSKKGF